MTDWQAFTSLSAMHRFSALIDPLLLTRRIDQHLAM
jgi:hypothetical protein